MRGNLHDLKDQLGLMSHVTKWNTQVNDVADIPTALNEAFRPDAHRQAAANACADPD